MKFVISTHGFDFGIGGLKVLHKLCHLLNEQGYDAYLVPFDFDQPFAVYEGYNTKIITQEILNNLDDCIVVYPESWRGNYLSAPNVVRWMLGPPVEDVINTWSPNDLWFWYQPQYITSKYNNDRENQLHISEQHRDIFYDRGLVRNETCWTMRKAQGLVAPSAYVHPANSTFIPYHAAGQLEQLSELFNRSTVFYCYDNYTYLPIQALMCNTDSVVIPTTHTKEQIMEGHELYKYIAFGLDDLDRARSLRGEFLQHLTLVEEKSIQQLRSFVEKCCDYFNIN
jgi:hypothetical protein